MRAADRFFSGWQGRRLGLLLGAAGLLAIGFLASGCDSDDPAGAEIMTTEGALGAEFAVDVPTMAELTSRLNLSTEQAGRMETILADWREDAGERLAHRAERRAAHRAGQKDVGGSLRPFEAPGLDHLADAAAVLDNDQLASFATYIEERRAARRLDRKNGRGAGNEVAGPMAKRFAERLGVSDEEMKQVRQVHLEKADQMLDLHTRYAEGKLGAEELRDGLKAIRLDTEKRMKEILGEEDFARMHERRDEIKEKVLDRRSENLDQRVAKQSERLGRALRLDEAGQARLASAMNQTLPARRALLDQVANDGLAPEERLYQGILVEKDASAGIRAALLPEEAVRFDALRRLLPVAAGATGAGLGHWGPGFHHGGHH